MRRYFLLMPWLCDFVGAACEAVPGDAKKITFVLLKAHAYVEEIFGDLN
jgi:hypothetical protein